MAIVTAIKEKAFIKCDICGNEILINDLDIKDQIGIRIQNHWWKINEFQLFDICKKHNKEVIKFLNKLKINKLKGGKTK